MACILQYTSTMPLRLYDSKEGCDGYVARLRNEHKTDRYRHEEICIAKF